MIIFTDDELDEVEALAAELLVGVSYDATPRKYTLLCRVPKIIRTYKAMHMALRAIYNIPGRQMAGLPWLASLQAILMGVFQE